MTIASQTIYLAEQVAILKRHWPDNRTVNLVFHGHSVPAGYFATPMVDTFHAYPHLLHWQLKQRFPFAVINCIVTAIGGENSAQGAARFETEVLCHRPDVLFIDYGLNDRGLGLERAQRAWEEMLKQALAHPVRVILLTPTPDNTQYAGTGSAEFLILQRHAAQIRSLAEQYQVGLVDSLAAFEQYPGHLSDLLSWSNHPNRAGHELVARELLRWFPADR